VGKLTRLTDAHPPETFSVFGGSTDWLIPGLIGKSCGAVTGLANTHPRSVVKLYNLFQAGEIVEAQKLQGLVSRAEWAMGNTGMSGTKYAVEWVRQYKEKVLPRAPLMECEEGVKEWIRETMKDLTVYERNLAGKAQFIASRRE
jgi:4-hydroxy-2-oxoglutarate aldolase